MGETAAILVDYRVGRDYCQDITEDHKVTTEVLDYCYKEGVQIDMRKEGWQSLNSSISNLLALYEHLRNEATRLLKEQADDDPLEPYLESVITKENIEELISSEGSQLPSIDSLRTSVEEMGLQTFRAFADDQIRVAQTGQSKLDLMIDQRIKRGGQSIWMYETSIKRIFNNSTNIELLLDSYVWSDGFENDSFTLLVTKEDSSIYSYQEEVYDSLRQKQFVIASPREIAREID